jgi:hypothetical protein
MGFEQWRRSLNEINLLNTKQMFVKNNKLLSYIYGRITVDDGRIQRFVNGSKATLRCTKSMMEKKFQPIWRLVRR